MECVLQVMQERPSTLYIIIEGRVQFQALDRRAAPSALAPSAPHGCAIGLNFRGIHLENRLNSFVLCYVLLEFCPF